MAEQTLAGALFSAMINASLIAVQGPRITQDAASMKKIMDSVDALQVALDKWFAVSAGMEMSTADVAAITARPGSPLPPAPGQKTRVTQSGIIVADESDLQRETRPGNIPIKERAINPPNRVRKPRSGGADDPFKGKFFEEGEDMNAANTAAEQLMERIARETLGTQGDE